MDSYTKLAKNAVENCIQNKKIIKIPDDLPPELYSRKSGVFVTIYDGKDLRGCIGTYLPTKENIASEIISNAIAACSRDYRFNPISKNELADLKYEVSLLSSLQEVKDIKKHNPKKHGIIVRCADGRCGLLLPDIPSIRTTDEQIAIACEKGDIDKDNDSYKLYYFTVKKHA